MELLSIRVDRCGESSAEGLAALAESRAKYFFLNSHDPKLKVADYRKLEYLIAASKQLFVSSCSEIPPRDDD